MTDRDAPSAPDQGRRQVPRRDLATLVPAKRNPLGILERQNSARLQDLVPLRIERMSASPFAFYRGTAAIMAADQATDPHSGILVASCGDAHLSNFGLYASPQRALMFDLNDFDEAAWAPWEWDVKRLVTSVVIGGRATDRNGSVVEAAARGAIEAYVDALRSAAKLTPLERFYTHFDPRAALHSDTRFAKMLRVTIKDAERRTGTRAAFRLTEPISDGSRRFLAVPPAMTHLDAGQLGQIQSDFEQYRRSAYVDVRALLSQYNLDDIARRAVGVGSVGTRCFVALLRDRDGGLLILQVKEAGRSVLEEFGCIPQPPTVEEDIAAAGQGSRVVGLQRILQAFSDPFLGYIRRSTHDFYVRQFHDMKGSVEVEGLDDKAFVAYAAVCAKVLARAHSQSPRFRDVVDYIGKGRRIADSLLTWGYEYAEVSRGDYEAFLAVHRDEG